MTKDKILKETLYGLEMVRALNFTAQGALLPLIDKWIGKRERSIAKFGEHLKMALPKVQKLLSLDSENIACGYYPMSVLFQESPLNHYMRIPLLVRDAVRANQQRVSHETAAFEDVDRDFVEQTPEYYRRNFHFQKGGYLNDLSARLYDHQVEILFSGTAQAMRRQIIPALKKHFLSSDGQGLKFLEIGSGTGALIRAVSLAFPKAQITCLDISPHYLKYAQSQLSHSKRINYVQGLGEELDFKDETFDAVFSCYLFHELPLSIRKKVIREKYRVLKPGGFLGIMDSLQKQDDPDLDWALKQFPIDFHEPFYKNYTENSLEQLLQDEGISKLKTEIHFLTKIVMAAK